MDKSFLCSDTHPQKRDLINRYFFGGRVLDIGCGSGQYASYYKHASSVIQIDMFDRRLEQFRTNPFLIADLNKALPDVGEFDLILAFDIMEHLDHDEAFLEWAYRCLSAKGYFLLSVPNRDWEILKPVWLTHAHFTDKTHRREYEKNDLISLLTKHGFQIAEYIEYENHALLHAGSLLAKNNVPAKLAAKSIFLLMKVYKSLGLFNRKIIPDHFIVVKK